MDFRQHRPQHPARGFPPRQASPPLPRVRSNSPDSSFPSPPSCSLFCLTPCPDLTRHPLPSLLHLPTRRAGAAAHGHPQLGTPDGP